MANLWLRLWHDMPTDPKWKTIARVSTQPISLVQSIYLHLLVDASRNVTRGHVTVTHEDLASALDVTEEAVSAVINAMQGRVLDGNYLTGWDKRQVKREEPEAGESQAKSASQRKREQREREKESRNVTEGHDASRNVTLDKDKKREDIGEGEPSPKRTRSKPLDFSAWKSAPSVQVLSDWFSTRKMKKAPVTQTVVDAFATQINLAVADGHTADECLSLCIVKGWQGFQYSWFKNEESKNANPQGTGTGFRTAASPVPTRGERNEQAHRDYVAQLEREAAAEAGGHVASVVEPGNCYGPGGQ